MSPCVSFDKIFAEGRAPRPPAERAVWLRTPYCPASGIRSPNSLFRARFLEFELRQAATGATSFCFQIHVKRNGCRNVNLPL